MADISKLPSVTPTWPRKPVKSVPEKEMNNKKNNNENENEKSKDDEDDSDKHIDEYA